MVGNIPSNNLLYNSIKLCYNENNRSINVNSAIKSFGIVKCHKFRSLKSRIRYNRERYSRDRYSRDRYILDRYIREAQRV